MLRQDGFKHVEARWTCLHPHHHPLDKKARIPTTLLPVGLKMQNMLRQDGHAYIHTTTLLTRRQEYQQPFYR
ncbi:hypothetical protein Sjap_003172 [Stephania japonica]|uniref:Uncharacterized protein n=1 Tax=Stephania japonica TaxID=461633 RepID=A0AAP0PTB7_9MAGN